MAKQVWKGGTLIYPVPAVMVSCGKLEGEKNIITVAWTGTINTNPPMAYISLRLSAKGSSRSQRINFSLNA